MVPIALEFVGATILGGAVVGGLLPRSFNPFLALTLVALGGIAAFLLYRYVHLLALRLLPLKIATIALSGGIWVGALWLALPRAQAWPILSIIVFAAASAIKAFTMKRLS